jgi:hypothetical protein
MERPWHRVIGIEKGRKPPADEGTIIHGDRPVGMVHHDLKGRTGLPGDLYADQPKAEFLSHRLGKGRNTGRDAVLAKEALLQIGARQISHKITKTTLSRRLRSA